ncbi:MAG: Sds3-like-domain-containing protein [Benjaminiella poitrasii]|nr:MAG: Sds3-like-domain-containing protein [Benjaminiella poitrasii]
MLETNNPYMFSSTTQPPSLPPPNNDHLQSRPHYYLQQEDPATNRIASINRHSEEHYAFNDGYPVRPQYPTYSHIKRELSSPLPNNNILLPPPSSMTATTTTSTKPILEDLPPPPPLPPQELWYNTNNKQHKLINTTADFIDSGDTKKHKRRKEMSTLMEDLNQDFLEKRERLYVEKLNSINQELKDAYRDKHALYLDGLRDLELMRQKMIYDGSLFREYQDQVTDNQFRLEIYQAEEEYTAETQEIREKLFNVLEEKRKKLKEDKDNCDLAYGDVILDSQSRMHKRNLRKRGPDHAENKSNKKKQTTGPTMALRLKDDDILCDLQAMRAGSNSSFTANNNNAIGSPTVKTTANKKK